MNVSTKLKPVNWAAIIAGFIFLTFFFIILRNILSYEAKIKIFGIFFLVAALISLIIFLKTKQLLSIIMMLIALMWTFSYLFDYKGIFFVLPTLLLLTFYFYLGFIDSKYNSHYRQILELAAKPVNEAGDGFTPRPFPAGELHFSKDDISGFAKFLKEQRIALPFFEENGIILIIKDYEKYLFKKPTLENDSYISFAYDGSVTVKISKKDYRRYKEELTFDQLCESLGNLFKTFLKYFREGEKAKILAMLKGETT